MKSRRAKNTRIVPIGELAVSAASEDVLVAYGLGSCVAICLYDPVTRAGGMLHALLPSAKNEHRGSSKLTKFVEQGTPLLVDALLELGARRICLQAYLCGGSQMRLPAGFQDLLDIGRRNVLAATVALKSAGLQITAQSTGGELGRTVRFYIATGQVTVKTLEHGEQVLNAGQKA